MSEHGIRFAEGYAFSDLAFLYFIYALSTISFVMFLSVFFNKAKVAAQVLYSPKLGYGFHSTPSQFSLLSEILQRVQLKQSIFASHLYLSSGELQQRSLCYCFPK